MLREARGRSEVLQWARTELSMRKEALSRGSPRPIVTSDLCVLIEDINPCCRGRGPAFLASVSSSYICLRGVFSYGYVLFSGC